MNREQEAYIVVRETCLENARMDIRVVADSADVPEWARNRLWRAYRELEKEEIR